MDISNKRDESKIREIESLIEKRDKETPSPEERAGYVFNLIKDHNNNITNWDLLCFCSEFLGSQIAVYEWLADDEIRTIARIVQEAHYYRDEIPETGIVK